MANGIVIHVSAGEERRTEFFGGERVKLGTDASCDLQFEPPENHALSDDAGVWLELRRENGSYRVANFKEQLEFQLNNAPLALFTKLRDGDSINTALTDISLQFFTVAKQSALTPTAAGSGSSRPMRFIEEAALESAASPKRDDAKVFLREFVRELVNEIGWTTKIVTLLIVIGALSGIFYIGFAVAKELQRTREVNEALSKQISDQQNELVNTRDQIDGLAKSNKDFQKQISLAPTLRNDYGGGICLLVGTYDLVDRKTNRQLRYPDPTAIPSPDPYEPAPTVSESGDQMQGVEQQSPLTTEGSGTAVEFDFVGTGFHVGSGYIVTNRHVVQPWAESEQVKVMTRLSGGRARLRKLVVYFPGFPQPFVLRVREISNTEDLAVASLDPNSVFPEIPVLPLDNDSDAARVGKSVVTMGYPNGPDRILAMVDEKDARTIQARYGQSLQTLINFLAQDKRINPLTTQGYITDLDAKRIVHDAKTAEGGSGAPLFGASGRVIGVNFGVFTESTASNMAVPIKYALPLLKRSGWIMPENQTPTAINPDADKTEAKNSGSANTNSNKSSTRAAQN